MKRAAIVLTLLAVAGCQTKPLNALSYSEQQEMIQTLLTRCHEQGVEPGTQAEKDCFAQEVRAEQYRRNQNVVAKARMRESLQEMSRNQAMINAARAGNRMNCTSSQFGNQIQTSCY